MSQSNNGRIAKNTFLLYFRMLITMGVSLYTSRVVLSTLGIEDYGIYNVVGGIVMMFGFLSSSMASSTQRFLTVELAENNIEKLRIVFSSSLLIHAFIALIIIILASTIGLWFFFNKMIIPLDRVDAAIWVYIFSILTAVVVIMSVPYNATIIAHEKMSAFAYVSILEVILKLIIVYVLVIFDYDKLQLYAVLSFLVQILIRIIYGSYCTRKFPETSFRLIKDWNKLKEMRNFAGWSMFGNLSAIAFTQGLNLLLNVFFTPAVNAARAIAVQVQQAISTFSLNFQTAINPQIMKSYAQKDILYMHSLIYRSAKISFFLLLMISLPIFLAVDTILELWLKIVPEYTSIFIRIILCSTIIDATANSLMRSADATGKIRRYQSIVGGILLTILPISYIVLKLGGDPPSVFIVHLIMCVIAFIVRLFIIRPMIGLSLSAYFKEVIKPIILVTLVSIPIPLFICLKLDNGFISLLIISFLSVICVATASFYLGLNSRERGYAKKKIVSLLSKFIKLNR